jgi:hypothetical protein
MLVVLAIMAGTPRINRPLLQTRFFGNVQVGATLEWVTVEAEGFPDTEVETLNPPDL